MRFTVTTQAKPYPKPTHREWVRILRRCKKIATGYDTPCWIWTGRIDPDGYGEAKYRGAKRFVHRIAYAWVHGLAPGKQDVDHKCRQRACCNPDHLRSIPSLLNRADQNGMDSAPEQVNRLNLDPYVTGNRDEIPF